MWVLGSTIYWANINEIFTTIFSTYLYIMEKMSRNLTYKSYFITRFQIHVKIQVSVTTRTIHVQLGLHIVMVK